MGNKTAPLIDIKDSPGTLVKRVEGTVSSGGIIRSERSARSTFEDIRGGVAGEKRGLFGWVVEHTEQLVIAVAAAVLAAIILYYFGYK